MRVDPYLRLYEKACGDMGKRAPVRGELLGLRKSDVTSMPILVAASAAPPLVPLVSARALPGKTKGP